jgi:hypothetical protein
MFPRIDSPGNTVLGVPRHRVDPFRAGARISSASEGNRLAKIEFKVTLRAAEGSAASSGANH